MSKVYEALRQKQSEISGTPSSFYDEVINIDASTANVDAEAIDDMVLRTAFHEESETAKLATASTPSDIHAEASRQASSEDEYRSLPLARADTSKLVFLTDPHGLAAEQFRFLRRNLEQKFPKGAVLMITSPAPRDGKTLTSINLSACLGNSGQATLLLEGDIRQPAIKKVLGESVAASGIEDALAGTVDAGRTICLVENLGFHVSMVRNPPADPSYIVSGKGTEQFMAWAREHFHWVVIDSPPVLPAVDVAQLSTFVDAILLVVRAESTPRALLTRSLEMLGDRLSGIVMNDAMVESNSYYRYFADYRS